MMQLRNIKTVWKITILILFMAAFLALVGYVGHYAANTLAGKMDEMYKNRLLPIQWLNDSRVESRRNESLTFALFMAKDPTERQRIAQNIEEHKKAYSDSLEKYKQSGLSDTEKQNLDKIASETQAYRGAWQKSLDLAMAGQSEEGHALFYKEAFPHLEAINKLLDEMVAYNDKMAEDEKHKSEELAVYNDRISMGITVLAVLLSALLGWVITRLLVVPLNGLLAEVHRMTGGDLKNRAVHTVYYDDEVGQLTKEFDTMAGHLHRLVKNISEATQQLAESSSSLNLGAEEAAKVTEQITGSVENVAEGAEHQSQLIDKTTLGVQQMAAAIDQVGNNSMAVAQSVAKTVEAATAGEKSAESVKEQMNAIETTVESSAVAVKNLGDRSQEIGQIVDTISGIAGQTNLLALNAAIEAARAGENGKGFAVVAEEVRKLAEQSKDAAAKIAAMISEIQQETEKAVIAMNKGSEEVKLGADVVEGAGKNFRDINSLVNAVSMQTTEISAAIEEMMANSQEIEHAVKDIDKVGKQAVGKTQTVSAATEEHAASIEEILAASENLAATAKSLQQAVEFFKV